MPGSPYDMDSPDLFCETTSPLFFNSDPSTCMYYITTIKSSTAASSDKRMRKGKK